MEQPVNDRPFRVYADTSVFGGVFDSEFAQASQMFFDQVRQGRFSLVVSSIVQTELELAPEVIRSLYDEVAALSGTVQFVGVSLEALGLQQAYLNAGIVTLKSEADALHVASATVASCSLIVSWNFRHIVHFEKIPLYNAVNILKGYPQIAIYSPLEVVKYED